jgi:hypothetical protein
MVTGLLISAVWYFNEKFFHFKILLQLINLDLRLKFKQEPDILV